MNLYTYASPATFYNLAGRLIPWFAWGAGILTLNPSEKPSELIEACRGDDQPEAVAEDFLPEPDLSDEPFQ